MGKQLGAATAVIMVAAIFLSLPHGGGKEKAAIDDALKIQPGSALAKLKAEIEAHPKMLLAKATKTKSGHLIKSDVPDWVRAHYMRNHPQVLTAANAKDPTGGFPMALENLYVWMLRHQDLKRSAPPAFAAAKLVAAGKNLRISGLNTTPLSESDISINFMDPLKIIAASNNIGGGGQAHFFSTDGGASWGQTNLPIIAGDSFHSDPTVGWTSDGTAWATTIGINAGATNLQMRSYKSVDDGQTWTFDATFSGDQTSADKQMVCVDRSATSAFKDTIHVIWHNNNPAFVNRRTMKDGWQSPTQVSGAETTGTAIGSDITTNSKGEVFAVWPDTGSQNLFFIKSTDGGATYSAPVAIAKTFASFQVGVPAFAKRDALVGVSIGAFRDATQDNVYVSWVDLSGEMDCDSSDKEPGTDVKSNCKSRIWFIRSTNGGATWTEKARKINDLPDNSDQFNHRLAVDPDDGTLGIVYYNTGKGAGRKKSDVFFQVSADHGKTWNTATTVTTAKTDETTVSADLGNQYGDYNGLSVVKGVFFPTWTDRRDNKTEAIYTSKITLKNMKGVVVPVFASGK